MLSSSHGKWKSDSKNNFISFISLRNSIKYFESFGSTTKVYYVDSNENGVIYSSCHYVHSEFKWAKFNFNKLEANSQSFS